MAKAGKFFSVSIVMALALSLGLTATLCLPMQVNAADVHVTTAAELQASLDTAQSNGEDDIIYLAAGTYEGNFEYTPHDGMSLTIKGEAGTTAQDIILDGGADGIVLDLGCSSEGGSVSIEGITIQNGSGVGYGGGLCIDCGDGRLDITLSQVIIQNNSSEWMGGGIYLRTRQNSTINMDIYDSVIRYNQSPGYTSSQGRGGGIYTTSYAGNSTIDLLIVNSLIYKNQAHSTGGGIDSSACQ